LKLATSNLVHKFCLGSRLPKKVEDQTWLSEHLKKFGTPCLFFASVESNDLVHNLGLGNSLPKTTFRTKIGGVWAMRESKKLRPLIYFSNCQTRNSKLDTQLGFGE